MKRKKMYLQFLLRPDRKKGNMLPVAVRLFSNGKQKVRLTGLYTLDSDWLKDKQRSSYNHKLNLFLAEIESKFQEYQITRDRFQSLDECMFFMFNELIHSGTPLKHFIESFCIDQFERKDISRATIKRYETVGQRFVEFLKINGLESMPLSDVSEKLIVEWDKYLQNFCTDSAGIGQNTRMKYHSMIRTMFISAYNSRLIDRNPYALFKLKTKPVNRPFLTEVELSILLTKQFEEQSLEKVRLIFLFSCFTGIRFNDAQRLKRADLQIEGSGSYVTFIVSKTGKQQTIPLIPVVREILDNMDRIFFKELEVKGTLLPKISNQKFNKNLKLVAARLGFEKNLSHHIARHTFATTMLNRGVKLEALQILLGHSNFRETQIYAKISPAYLRQELNGIGDFKKGIE